MVQTAEHVPFANGNNVRTDAQAETTYDEGRDPYENIILTRLYEARVAGGLVLQLAQYTHNPEELPRN